MSGNEAFELVSGSGWTRGLSNLFRSGVAGWFKTRTWWIQCLIWGGVINLILVAVAFTPDAPPFLELLMLYSVFASLFPAVGVVILMQDAIVSEKREGTAAWVLSKPVSRPAFVLSKVITNSLGVLVTMVFVPGIISYVILTLAGKSTINPLSFLGAMVMVFVSHFFFLTLTLMLGTLFAVRGPVIGIPLAILFFQQNLIGFLPALRYVLPWNLTISIGNNNSFMFSLMTHLPIQTDQLVLLLILVVESILFTVIGIWRFNREEL